MQRTSLGVVLCLILIATAIFAADAKPTEAYFTTSDGVKIHYYVMGKGTPVILIHGYTGTAWGNWFTNGIAQALAKNHMVVALDCRNHGKSDKPVANGPGKAEDVVELMDHLKIKKAHFHGYSMGGGITARLLSMIPDRFITAAFGGSGMPLRGTSRKCRVLTWIYRTFKWRACFSDSGSAIMSHLLWLISNMHLATRNERAAARNSAVSGVLHWNRCRA